MAFEIFRTVSPPGWVFFDFREDRRTCGFGSLEVAIEGVDTPALAARGVGGGNDARQLATIADRRTAAVMAAEGRDSRRMARITARYRDAAVPGSPRATGWPPVTVVLR